jgi:signal recognition particle receptor subunit beta
MAIFNYKNKEIIGKIVYYGPGLGGKTTSLQYLHQHIVPDRRGEMLFLNTDTDRTIYFELLPLRVGRIQDFRLRFQVYTVPGQVKYNNTRRAVLQGADAIVFVADSQRSRQEANGISLDNLKANLAGYNQRLEDVPLVYQYNKRDLEAIATIEELNRDLNPRGLPYFESVAREGIGILDAFELISSLAIQGLEERLRRAKGESTTTSTSISPQEVSKSSEQTSSGYLSGDDDEAYFGSTKEVDLFSFSSSDIDPFTVTYEGGDVIFEKGDPAKEMYFVEDGKVEFVELTAEFKKKVLITYGKGDLLGETILFNDNPRPVTAIAKGVTHLVPITKESLNDQIRRKPEIAFALIKTLTARIQRSNQMLSNLADQNKKLTQRLNETYNLVKKLTQEIKVLKQVL